MQSYDKRNKQCEVFPYAVRENPYKCIVFASRGANIQRKIANFASNIHEQRRAMSKATTIIMALWLWCIPLVAQYAWQRGDSAGQLRPLDGQRYRAEAQVSASSGTTPLWLNANRYGLSSLKKSNGYVRVAVERPLAVDSARRWGLGYGFDVAAAYNYQSSVVLQQAYVEGRWLHGVLTVGAKQWPMELKNQRLSSGSQALGINARPVPQVRLALPEYWTVPLTGGWVGLKAHIAYGMFTDADWQDDFSSGRLYNSRVLYHSKAGYLRIARPGQHPLSVEMGLEMAAQFGGKRHQWKDGRTVVTDISGHGLKSFWNVFIPGGSDPTDGQYENIEGNELGSWVARVNYDAPGWRLSVYADHYFEDHSQMFFLDYNGYDTGPNYMDKKHSRFFFYPPKDMMLGAELQLKHGRWIKGVVVEYLYTKYQSGPVYHNNTSAIADHIGGRDNYYNHGSYFSWQHWGQVMGNPLYRSPLYNDDGTIAVTDNRFVAWHIGIEGQPADRLSYRVLGTWQRGYGTYDSPYTRARHNRSLMVEAAYSFGHGWGARAAWGMDAGSILGHNQGLQVTISKTGNLK